MYKAYKAVQLLKLPLGIECIRAFGDNLVVGTKQGHLLMYHVRLGNELDDAEDEENGGDRVNVVQSTSNPPPPTVAASAMATAAAAAATSSSGLQLVRSNKNFSKKPVTQVEVVPELGILVAVCAESAGGGVAVHDVDPNVATNFPVVSTLSGKTKGAACFCLDVVKAPTLTEAGDGDSSKASSNKDAAVVVRMAVAVRKRILLFYWKNRRFHDYSPAEFLVPDTPVSMAWSGNVICVVMKSGYFMYHLDKLAAAAAAAAAADSNNSINDGNGVVVVGSNGDDATNGSDLTSLTRPSTGLSVASPAISPGAAPAAPGVTPALPDPIGADGVQEQQSVTLLKDGRFALSNDDHTLLVRPPPSSSSSANNGDISNSSNKKQQSSTTIRWSGQPLGLVQDQPFLVAVLQNGTVEVKTDEPRLSVQRLSSFPSPKPRLMCAAQAWSGGCCPGSVYLASHSHIWCLKMLPAKVQIPRLLKDKLYQAAILVSETLLSSDDEAIDLAEFGISAKGSSSGKRRKSTSSGGGGSVRKNRHDPPEKSHKRAMIDGIEILNGFYLFSTAKNYQAALDIFFRLNVDPSHVIGLYSDLLPTEYQNQLAFPDRLPILPEGSKPLENALTVLIEYLTKVRHKLAGSLGTKTLDSVPMMHGCIVVRSRRQLGQIVDTTLLKCYLKTNNALAGPLLRLKDNLCHMEETERVLRKSAKYPELVAFYNSRGLHSKSLDILAEHAVPARSAGDNPSSCPALAGFSHTVSYLQNLSKEHIELVLKHAAPVLDADPELGVKIFVEDTPEVEGWPRDKVLDFLMHQTGRSSLVVVRYLEHVIGEWGEKTSFFHNTLALAYKDVCVQLMDEQLDDAAGVRGDGDRTLASVPGKLKDFLAKSEHYTAEIILTRFPTHCLHEERAMLLGRLHRHRDALAIYLYVLEDIEKAKRYCETAEVTTTKTPGGKNWRYGTVRTSSAVHSILYKLLVKPVSKSEMRSMRFPEDVIDRHHHQDDDAAAAASSSSSSTSAPSKSNVDAAVDLLNTYGPLVDIDLVLDSTPADVSVAQGADYLTGALDTQLTDRRKLDITKGLMRSHHISLMNKKMELLSRKVVLTEDTTCDGCHKRIKAPSAFIKLPNGLIAHLSCKDKVEEKQ